MYVFMVGSFIVYAALVLAGLITYFYENFPRVSIAVIALIIVFPTLYWIARYVLRGAKIIG